VEDRRLLDTVGGKEEDAWKKAFVYADILRKRLKMPDLIVAVESPSPGIYYLYLEAERSEKCA
jgi:hypothetical protein